MNVMLALTIYLRFSGWAGWWMSAQELEQRTDVIEASTVYRENKEDEQINYIELAEDEQTLDLVQQELQEKGFLAQLQEYEPVDFAVGK